jgi:hypothetical protein
VEYREGFSECSDCRVALAAGSPPKPNPHFDPSLDLAIIFETNDPFRAALAEGLLDDAGIPFYALGQIATLVRDVDGFLRKWVRLQVPRDPEAEARELLATIDEAQPLALLPEDEPGNACGPDSPSTEPPQ